MDASKLKLLQGKDKLVTACQLFTNRSLCYYQLNNDQAAIEDSEYVISNLDPKNAKAFFRKGMSLVRMGQQAKAIEALQQAVKLEPATELYSNELANAKKKK